MRMPTSLDKTRKAIAKKRNGEVTSLHSKSRDSMRLHKAGARDLRLQKLASTRKEKEQPIVDRVVFFQQGLRDQGGSAMELSTVQDLISTFIHQYDEEFDEIKKARRPGRPASVREDLLKIKITALQKEYTQGFLLPDVINPENAAKLEQYEGSWSFLTTLPWIKVSSSGKLNPGDFPSKGLY